MRGLKLKEEIHRKRCAKILQYHHILFQKMTIIAIDLLFSKLIFIIFFRLCFVERTNKYFFMVCNDGNGPLVLFFSVKINFVFNPFFFYSAVMQQNIEPTQGPIFVQITENCLKFVTQVKPNK